MKRVFICILTFGLLTGTLHARLPGSDSISYDPEQQQLEWCFVYSNQLGYDIQYIVNPRLYETVSKWLGTPYKYSGESKNGVDCSGFICHLFKASYNLQLEGCSADLFKTSDPVKKNELKEGDLVFFKIHKNRVSHVGVYLGQNKFAHASTQHGVIISDLDDPYYSKYFFRGGRIKS